MTEDETETPLDPEDVRLERLGPLPGSRTARRRIGRGEGSGRGKTAGRGTKGLGARSGRGVRPGFAGGQMPFYMQQGKQRGANKKMSMPMGPFRTHTVPVNVGSLAVFTEGTVVDAAALADAGLVKNNDNRGWPIKILGDGEIEVALTVRAEAFSAAARRKIEAAGGTAEVIAGGDETTPAPEADPAGGAEAGSDSEPEDGGAPDAADAEREVDDQTS